MTQTPLLHQPFIGQSPVYGGITWQQFKLIQAGFAQSPDVKLFYYNGEIEILMPGREQEFFKTIIGMPIELFCLQIAIEFEPTGSITQEREKEVSAETDESYCFGESKSIPNLVVEDGLVSRYYLRGNGYEKISRSEILELATLYIGLLTRCVLIAQTSRLEAATVFYNALKPN